MLVKWSEWIWGIVLPLLLVSGVWLTLASRGFSLRYLGRAIALSLRPGRGREGEASPFSCLCTALAGTVGTGNIAGVAFALTLGGPGALVWMWISAAVGTAIKYAECALAVQYRRKKPDGRVLGGPMVTLTHLPWRRLGLALGCLYALLEICATLTASNLVQSSAISAALSQMAGVPAPLTGALVGGLLLMILSGGVKSVTRVSAALVPVMLGLYVLGGSAVLLAHPAETLASLGELLHQAFDLKSMGAGAFASMVRIGVTRGCFSNESGTGSAAFSAAVSTADPVRQGLISATANLWDTGLICSVTGLAILASGAMDTGLEGVALTMAAFRTGLGAPGAWIVGVCLVLFAFSTLPALAFQGEQALAFLTPSVRLRQLYRLGFSLLAALGCLMSIGPALAAADLFNALLIAINLVSLWALPAPGLKKGRPFDPEGTSC